MKTSIIILILTTTGICSYPQDVQSQKLSDYIDTKYEYTDSTGKSLIIQNSLPRGGLTYTDPNGEIYVYAVFGPE